MVCGGVPLAGEQQECKEEIWVAVAGGCSAESWETLTEEAMMGRGWKEFRLSCDSRLEMVDLLESLEALCRQTKLDI